MARRDRTARRAASHSRPVLAASAAVGVEPELGRAGVRDVTRRLFADGRHEMFNETNAAEVRAELVAWIDERCPRPRP